MARYHLLEGAHRAELREERRARPRDAPARFHLGDAPKSPLWNGGGYGPAGEDGGERIRDIAPEGGTLVLFDSVSLPHEVMPTVGRERFALSGWFHESVLS